MLRQILFYMRFFLLLPYTTVGALRMDIFKNYVRGQVTVSMGFIPEY